mmetsp:Transcript_16198/g.34295  ORF Transcript_16198/g.34295 Transcript_16198/m.34295 type:complete len:141 (+) Transcript_16198:93-515(+)
MEEPRTKNINHQMIIWKQLIETELKTAAEWETNWGFLKASKRAPATGTQEAMKTTGSQQALSSAGRAVVTSDARSSMSETCPAGFDDRSKVLAARDRLTPKQRFGRPITTSHQVGWRPTIEKFGVSHHGIKRDPLLWPEV